ncbi:hypothetical protein KAR91_15220 [Candidatus Pacearchaeota archaeon]|nr:hypothetical protein [Candidatus Pacearchaeota archaeon]
MKSILSLFVLISFTFSPAFLLAEEVVEHPHHGGDTLHDLLSESEEEGADHLGIQERGRFLSVSLGLMGQSRPSDDSALFPNFNLGYHRVDEAIAQVMEFHLGITESTHLIEGVYGIAFGPRKGLWHVGLTLGLGYFHTYDSVEEKHIHGLHYRVGPIFNFTLPWWLKPESARFQVGFGWAGLPMNNVDYGGTAQLGGWYFELGTAFSVH